MNRCNPYIEMMNQYLDGELSASEISHLLEHIDGCGDCRRRFDELKITAFELRHADEEPPAGLHDSIMQKVHGATLQGKQKRMLRPLISLAACAAIVLLLASGVTGQLNHIYLFGGIGKQNKSAETSVNSDDGRSGGAAQAPASASLARSIPEEGAEPESAGGAMIDQAAPYGSQQISESEQNENKQEDTKVNDLVLPESIQDETFAYKIVAEGEAGDINIMFPKAELFREDEIMFLCIPVDDSSLYWMIGELESYGLKVISNESVGNFKRGLVMIRPVK